MKSTTIVAGAIALALASTHVIAQPYGGYGPRGGMWGGGGPGMMGGGMWGGPQDVQERLAARKAALNITPQQEALWNEYAALVTKQAETMLARRDAMWNSAPTTSADRMAQHSTFMTQNAQQHAALSDAYSRLYAALSPEQRAIADQGFGPGAGYGKRGPGPGGWR